MNENLRRILLVHKCVGCNKILTDKDFDRAFCADCREIYLSAKMEICPECSLDAQSCRCMPKLLKKDKVVAFRKLFFYYKDKRSYPQNRLIYYLKGRKNKRVLSEVAKELSSLLRRELARSQNGEPLVLTCVPRLRRARTLYGFDQAALICRALSENCGIEFSPLIKRKRGGKAQKTLTAGERRKNIQSLLYANDKERESVRDKTVILVDDVVTTGASMSACIHILKECGVKNVICLAISSDIKR